MKRTKQILELKSKITTGKNFLEGFNRRSEQAEDRINKLRERTTEVNQFKEQEEERMKRSKQSLKDLWENIKYKPMCARWGPRRRKGKEACQVARWILAGSGQHCQVTVRAQVGC